MRLIEQLDKIQTMLAESSMTELEYDAITLEIKRLKRYYEIEKTELGPEEISFIIRNYYNLPKDFHTTKSRKRELVKGRQMCAKILIDNTTITKTKIGEYFGKDHASVIYSRKTINNLIETDRNVRREYGEIIKLINDKYGQLNQIL